MMPKTLILFLQNQTISTIRPKKESGTHSEEAKPQIKSMTTTYQVRILCTIAEDQAQLLVKLRSRKI